MEKNAIIPLAGFQRATLILDNNSTVVNDITVLLTLGHSFEVAPTDPTTTSTKAPLPGMPYARPFSIVPNSDQKLKHPPGAHSATLTMDAAAIAAWHTCFDDKYAIDLDMVLDDDSHLTLTVDLFCTQHSSAGMNMRASRIPAVVATVVAVLGVLIGWFTLQAFRHQ